MNAVTTDGSGLGTSVGQPESATGSQRRELYERPLTVRTYNEHKDRPMRLDERFVDDGAPVEHITAAVHELRNYRRDKADMKMVFEDGTETVSHRFNEAYAKQKYGEAKGAARVLQRESDDLCTAMITLRGYEFNANHEGRAYADHLHDLLASNKAVMNALRYYLGEKRGLDFGRLSVIQPHDTGHAHIQHGLWIDGHVDRDALQPAVDAHLEHCPIAREKSHEGRTITIRNATTDNGLSEALVYELGKDLVGYDSNITDTKYTRLGATLMAANVNQWRPDQGVFQDAIALSQAEYDGDDDRGEYEGIQFNEGGEVYDPSELGGKGGGVNMVDVTDANPDDDPLPKVS